MKFIRKALTALVATFAFATTAVAQTVGSTPTAPTGAPSIPTADFNVAAALRPAPIPASNGRDPVGAFRFICGAGQVNYDDPIVYPGVQGASHLHQYYGNTSVNYTTSFSTLRSRGGSTCNYLDGTHAANRSGYWMPAMLVGNQYVLQPDYVSIYYKRIPLSDPRCNNPALTSARAEGICVTIPNGLKMIWGYDMVTNTVPTGHGGFICVNGTVSSSAVFASLAELAKATDCPVSAHIEARISAPECWDGRNLDSSNHRAHVAYPLYGSWGYLRCPADHPYLMPTFTLAAFYQMTPMVHLAYAALATEAKAGNGPWDYTSILHLSSDEMRPTLRPGQTFHADYFEGWDPTVKAMWTNACIDTHLNCAGGVLGNGQALRGASQPIYNGFTNWMNPTPLIPIPPKPASSMSMSLMRM